MNKREQSEEQADTQVPPTKKYKSGSQKRKEKQLLEDKVKKLLPIDRFFKKNAPKENEGSSVCTASDAQASCSASVEPSCSTEEVGELAVHSPYEQVLPYYSDPLQELSDDPAEWPDIITDHLRCQTILRGPKQIKLEDFPLTDFPDHTKRQFSSAHYFRVIGGGKKVSRDWLIYSVLGDSIYCFCCRLYDSEAKSAFSSPHGFRDWKHVSGKGSLHYHETSSTHMSNYARWKELEASIKSDRTIDKDLRRQLHFEEQRWREVLLRLLKVIRWLAKNNLPFRGSSDTVFTPHNGIFLQLLQLIAEVDLVLKEHLQRAKQGNNVHYLSKDMQNKFLGLIANAVSKIIINKVKQAKFFSLIVDCTPDIAKQEQLSLVLRYVDMDEVSKTVEVKESFLEFLHVTDTTGRALANVVLERLTEQYQLCLSDIRGQCYDNGANMRGQYKGVQAIVLEKNPHAFFVPCSPHNWNLVIVHAAESSTRAKCFYDVLNRIYLFFAGANKRWEVASEHLSHLTLKALSQTRWCARLDSVKAILLQFSNLVEALEVFLHGTQYSSDTYSEAKIILDSICTYPFVVSLCVWYDILLQVNQISLAVQTKNINLSSVIPLVESVNTAFEEYLSSGFKQAECKATSICEKLNIPIEYPMHRIRRKTRQCSDKDCQEPACQQASGATFLNARTEFEETFFKPLLQTVLGEIKTRFQFLQTFTAKFGFLNDLKKAATDLSMLEHQCLNFADPAVDGTVMLEEFKTLARMLPDHLSPHETLQYIFSHSLNLAFPNLVSALQLLLTVPVSVASAERSFSKLKLIKNYLRSQMSQDRLNALALLSIESQEAECVDFNQVIHSFAAEKTRKIVL